MIWLSSSTLSRLRDQLRTRGERPSVAASAGASLDSLEASEAREEYGALAEAMFLMMAADGKVGGPERDVIRGALRQLSNDTLRSFRIDALLEEASARHDAEGREARIKAVAAGLAGDVVRGEVAFVLAAAVAFADNAIADEENETLNALADALGIDEPRATSLLDELEKEGSAASALSSAPKDAPPSER